MFINNTSVFNFCIGYWLIIDLSIVVNSLSQIEAHVGSVNDLAFSYPNKQLCVVTCGEDRVIKVCSTIIDLFTLGRSSLRLSRFMQVWDAVTGAQQYAFEGHEAPVYSVCPHHKENIQVIFFSFYHICLYAITVKLLLLICLFIFLSVLEIKRNEPKTLLHSPHNVVFKKY